MKLKKYDIVTIAEGSQKPVEQYGVQASSIEQLRQMYAMVGEQIIEIRREYDGDIIQDSRTNPEYMNMPDKIPQSALTQLNQPRSDVNTTPQQFSPEIPQETREMTFGKQQPQPTPAPEQTPQSPGVKPNLMDTISRGPSTPTPPKFYTIGDVEIKEQDGKIYQKQWIRIDCREEQNYRLVSDSTNKIVPLKGKHLEMKKWILVETEGDDQYGKTLING